MMIEPLSSKAEALNALAGSLERTQFGERSSWGKSGADRNLL